MIFQEPAILAIIHALLVTTTKIEVAVATEIVVCAAVTVVFVAVTMTENNVVDVKLLMYHNHVINFGGKL